MDLNQILVVINAGTLVTLITVGYRIIRFINQMEFRTEILWGDYEHRTKSRRDDSNDEKRR